MKIQLTDIMMQAFADEIQRQRIKYGWPQHPKPPVAEWPEDERNAFKAAFGAMMKVAGLTTEPPPR